MIFNFERDFSASLRCIPMIARQKLDLVGVKLSLRQWSRFTRDERGQLAELPCETSDEQDVYRSFVVQLIEARSNEPPIWLTTHGFEDWQEATRIPEMVKGQALADGVAAPTAAQWKALTPLQRFALVKLARSKHENENFVPAMQEFGIL